MVCLDLWKCLFKEDSFKPRFEVREGGEIPQAGRQRIPDSWGNETERMVTNRFELAFRDFQKFLSRWSECVWSLKRAQRSWQVRGKCKKHTAYTHTHTLSHTHTHTHTLTHSHTYTHTHTHTHTHSTHTYTHTHTHTHTHGQTHMHDWKHMHTHTHTHTCMHMHNTDHQMNRMPCVNKTQMAASVSLPLRWRSGAQNSWWSWFCVLFVCLGQAAGKSSHKDWAALHSVPAPQHPPH